MSAVLTAPVLTLNRIFAPIRVIDVRRALSLLVAGSAEVIDTADPHLTTYDLGSWQELSALRAAYEADQHEWIGLVRGRLAVPQVVRLTRFDRHRRAKHGGVALNRRNIYFRDRNVCQYCGKRFPTSELSLDHVHPRSKGGRDTWENLVCACTSCNSRKADKTPVQAGLALIRPPRALKTQAQLITLQHASWAQFVDEAYWNVELRT